MGARVLQIIATHKSRSRTPGPHAHRWRQVFRPFSFFAAMLPCTSCRGVSNGLHRMFLILAPLFPAVRRMALDLVSPAEESYSLNKVSLGKTIARAEVEAETTKGEELERMSTSRLYYPGQSYEADDIAPSVGIDKRSLTRQSRRAPLHGSRVDKLLSDSLDFRNAGLLKRFVSDSGKLLAKRKSRLAVKVHRKAVKHVKTSRVMGIVPILGRFQELTKRRKWEQMPRGVSFGCRQSYRSARKL